jgi:glutamate transport system permease protein
MSGGSSNAGALRFADPLGPRGRRRVLVATVVAVVALVLVVLVALGRLSDNGQLEGKLWRPLLTADAARAYWTALQNTLRAAALAMVLASLAGLVLAAGRLSSLRWLRRVLTVWVEFFRGTPLALLLVFLFFGVPKLVRFDPGAFWFLVIGLALYNSAVICEIVRAGVLSLDRGQTEAALAIGLTDGAALRLVVLPQAIRRMVPALVSQLVVILKDTSLGVIIAYPELLRRATLVGVNINARPQALFVAAVVYFVLDFALSRLAHWLEGRQDRIRKAARAGRIQVRGVEDLTV